MGLTVNIEMRNVTLATHPLTGCTLARSVLRMMSALMLAFSAALLWSFRIASNDECLSMDAISVSLLLCTSRLSIEICGKMHKLCIHKLKMEALSWPWGILRCQVLSHDCLGMPSRWKAVNTMHAAQCNTLCSKHTRCAPR